MSLQQGIMFLIVIGIGVTPIILMIAMKEYDEFRTEQYAMNEKVHILELMVKQNESEDDIYCANPRGIRWNYHDIDSDGNIRRKR